MTEFEHIYKDIIDRIYFVKCNITKNANIDCIVNVAMNSFG